MKLAVVDDNEKCREAIGHLLPDHEVTYYQSGQQLLSNYTQGQYHYIFLDVQMPGLSGFDTAEKIREADIDVGLVFVTNMASQMQEGFKYRAADYLIKPVTHTALKTLMTRLGAYHMQKTQQETYPVTLKHQNSITLLPLKDIIYFESRNQYVAAITATEEYLYRGSLESTATHLAEKGFLRTHNSYLINTQQVFRAYIKDLKIIMKAGISIAISRKYKKAVTAMLEKRW